MTKCERDMHIKKDSKMTNYCYYLHNNANLHQPGPRAEGYACCDVFQHIVTTLAIHTCATDMNEG